jgi:hypothetical protein
MVTDGGLGEVMNGLRLQPPKPGCLLNGRSQRARLRVVRRMRLEGLNPCSRLIGL